MVVRRSRDKLHFFLYLFFAYLLTNFIDLKLEYSFLMRSRRENRNEYDLLKNEKDYTRCQTKFYVQTINSSKTFEKVNRRTLRFYGSHKRSNNKFTNRMIICLDWRGSRLSYSPLLIEFICSVSAQWNECCPKSQSGGPISVKHRNENKWSPIWIFPHFKAPMRQLFCDP